MKRVELAIGDCGKKMYLTWEHASNDARALRRKGGRTSVYHCRVCQAWHVGTKLKTRSRKES